MQSDRDTERLGALSHLFEDGQTLALAQRKACVRRELWVLGGGLEPVECLEALDEVGRRRVMRVERLDERSARMHTAAGQQLADCITAVFGRDAFVAAIGIALQHRGAARKKALGMLGFPGLGVKVKDPLLRLAQVTARVISAANEDGRYAL